MDLVALLQEKVGPTCAGVHHRIWEDGSNVVYLSKEPICTPQLFEGYTQRFVKASDVVQAQISRWNLYIGTILGEHSKK